MESKICMNGLCGANSSIEWKKGWPLRSGEFAILCDKCGTAYEQLVFCDLFHSEDTGWRECISCGKRLHCGCIASSSLLELLDSGGINCVSCARSSQRHATPNHEKPKAFGNSISNSVGETPSTSLGSQMNGSEPNKREGIDSIDPALLLPHQNDNPNRPISQIKMEEAFHPAGDSGSTFSSNYKGVKDIHGSPVQTNLSIALSAPSPNTKLFPTTMDEGDLNKTISSLQQGSKSRNLLPKPPKSSSALGPETTAGIISQIRVARPPVEGRIKNQLLPRYWPRITDQELQQISGDSNSTIIPLFEKVLSASDAGRIGRLVLPKACAEAYFPPISQPEGLPLRIQDVKGKEWVFQFRFWPNNNSRMYVLEGVTPCIQSMQLQAGDTVTFSRMDPEGKLLMGFRKASTVNSTQENRLSAISKSVFSTEPTSFSAMPENLPLMSGYSGLLQSFKGSRESSVNLSSKHFNSGDFSWYLTEKNGGRNADGAFSPSMPVSERKRSRNIGSKSKRLLIDAHDALELKLSWEELQDMLRPPLTVQPTTVTIEDQEFEEYEQPPVLGKRSIFTVRLSGEQEQWAQCDNCFKWRRLPTDYLLPPRWTCQDNISDHSRCSCSVPDDLMPRELENLLKMDKDLKKQRSAAGQRQAHDSSDLDSQANGISIAGDVREPGPASVATTTKHPRHRPGCSCIVCIQPPSGKGKHNPTCTCNVCMTVKRRFKTLMMRKKKRQSEREAELGQQRNQLMWSSKEDTEVDSLVKPEVEPSDRVRSGSETLARGHSSGNQLQKLPEISKSQLDLNCQPNREDTGSSHISMMSLLQQAFLPLETYLRQNGLTSLVSEQQGSSGSQGLPQDNTRESDLCVHEDQCLASTAQEQEKDAAKENSEPDQIGKDHIHET
ncbi:B3 domain-containing transcription repressor VAL2-like isoform X1 [Lycium barbarum]|uniref:B3 domain-containing transcription repressor VAL2-like isoform X1 n=2 Tax=Lycium barbarum TaxID=112863 RepID=UPI00293E5B1B|nr:B3 domain-containing transcription repressor VAL2-like isoform X1 [Lycium barbarum]XP_060176335.1 B3 domain-containing transcription repressor VAL2-like isoform X1 [Lycium barbarum]